MFNWSEVHLYQSNFLQNPYFSLSQFSLVTCFLREQEKIFYKYSGSRSYLFFKCLRVGLKMCSWCREKQYSQLAICTPSLFPLYPIVVTYSFPPPHISNHFFFWFAPKKECQKLDYLAELIFRIFPQIARYKISYPICNTPTPWLTQLLVLGKSRVNQKSC